MTNNWRNTLYKKLRGIEFMVVKFNLSDQQNGFIQNEDM